MKYSDLLKLTRREKDEEHTCKRIAIVPTGRKNYSGHTMRAVVEVDGRNTPIMVLGFYDILWWYGDYSKRRTHTHPKNNLRVFWGDKITFTVGRSLTGDCEITVTKEHDNDR